MNDADALVGIRAIDIGTATANPMALAAIAAADVVVYGPGSFYTSVLPHLLVSDIAETIAGSPGPKILIGNMLEDRETRGVTLDEMAARLSQAGHGKPILTHILAHEGAVPVARVVGASRFVARMGSAIPDIEVIARDLEDPWHRGQHDAGLLAAEILQLSAEGVRHAR